jgi:hypothetical protein
MRWAAAALSLLVMQCLAKVEITRGTAIATLMHTKCPTNGTVGLGDVPDRGRNISWAHA